MKEYHKKTNFYKVIGDNISFCRIKNKYKQKEVAILIGVSTTNYNRIEKGRSRPSIELIYKICFLLKCDLYDILPRLTDVKSNDFNCC
mgnify:CR=1 FL=1